MQHLSYSAMSQTRCCWSRELRNSKGIVRWFFSFSNSWLIDQRVYSLNPLPLSRKKTSCSFCAACICVYVQDERQPLKWNRAQEKSRWVSWYSISKSHGGLQRGTGHAQHSTTQHTHWSHHHGKNGTQIPQTVDLGHLHEHRGQRKTKLMRLQKTLLLS